MKQILERDDKQVYDITIQKNLEIDDPSRDNWKLWLTATMGDPSPEQAAKSHAGHCLAGHDFDCNNDTPLETVERQAS